MLDIMLTEFTNNNMDPGDLATVREQAEAAGVGLLNGLSEEQRNDLFTLVTFCGAGYTGAILRYVAGAKSAATNDDLREIIDGVLTHLYR